MLLALALNCIFVVRNINVDRLVKVIIEEMLETCCFSVIFVLCWLSIPNNNCKWVYFSNFTYRQKSGIL